MPLYEYKCSSCGRVFEVLQRFSDPPLDVHENCGGEVERLLSLSALQFKGTGWYVTDYARASSRDQHSPGSGENGKQESSGSKKAESTTAAAAAPAKESVKETKPAQPGK